MLELIIFVALLAWALEILSIWWPVIALTFCAGLLILIADGD